MALHYVTKLHLFFPQHQITTKVLDRTEHDMFHTHAVDHHPASLQASSAFAVARAWNWNAVVGTVPKHTYCKSSAICKNWRQLLHQILQCLTMKTSFSPDLWHLHLAIPNQTIMLSHMYCCKKKLIHKSKQPHNFSHKNHIIFHLRKTKKKRRTVLLQKSPLKSVVVQLQCGKQCTW